MYDEVTKECKILRFDENLTASGSTQGAMVKTKGTISSFKV
jgi:hypothetical protein